LGFFLAICSTSQAWRRLWFTPQPVPGFSGDATVGIDVDGYTIAGKRNSVPHIACIKGVLGDATLFEKGGTRLSMAFQSRLEAKHARRADLVVTVSEYCVRRLEELYGVKNAADRDDDNDLLDDVLELSLLLDPCVSDTDGDGVEDGFEYKSAVDLNNDDYQRPNIVTPHPWKASYPNPLFKDADVDYDGDALTVSDEYKLWKYTYEVNHSATRTLEPLS